MFRIVYVLPFLCLELVIILLCQAPQCQAKEIYVELVWKLGQAGWVEIDVEQGAYQLIEDKKVLNYLNPKGSALQVGWGGWAPVIRINNEEFRIFQGTELELRESNPGSLRVKVPGSPDVVYRGGLKLNWQNSHWKVVNVVDSEDYLKGVVPIEMSNQWAEGGMEGLKAQAIAARTYLAKHTENGQKTITDSPDIDQAYAGKNVEGEASLAVEATQGEILVDSISKKPIEALYSSHSGGYTEDAKNVWGNADSHNVSHPDPFSEGVGGPANHWRFIISATVLGSTFGLGPVQNIELDKFPSGRVKSVKMGDGFGHSLTVTGRAFVKKFYPFGQPIQTEAFLGSLFKVRAIKPTGCLYGNTSLNIFRGFLGSCESGLAKSNQPTQGPLLAKIYSTSLGTSSDIQPFGTFIFEGRGWGHGVGMSQWGAYHMSQLGYNYKQILSFYYKNTLVR